MTWQEGSKNSRVQVHSLLKVIWTSTASSGARKMATSPERQRSRNGIRNIKYCCLIVLSLFHQILMSLNQKSLPTTKKEKETRDSFLKNDSHYRFDNNFVLAMFIRWTYNIERNVETTSGNKCSRVFVVELEVKSMFPSLSLKEST